MDVSNAADVARKVKAGELPGPAKSLAEALARIYADGGRYVQKTGTMQGPARYSYAKEGDFIAVIRPLMETHGVTIRPKACELILSEVIETQGDRGTRRQNRAVVRVTFELLHVSGDRADVQTFGEGIDSGDKAFNKAHTGAMKYALRQTFCVETGDDPDDTPSHEQERARTQPAPQPAPAQQQAPKDNPALRAQYAQRLGRVADRPGFEAVYRDYAADMKAGKLGPDDEKHLLPLFRDTGAKFPAQPAAAKK